MRLRQDVAEANAVARLCNGTGGMYAALEPLRAADGAVPAGFPDTAEAAHSLPEHDIDRLLGAYDLPRRGSKSDRVTRLLRFCGRRC